VFATGATFGSNVAHSSQVMASTLRAARRSLSLTMHRDRPAALVSERSQTVSPYDVTDVSFRNSYFSSL
jgi:hypothetical protein